jgi:cyanate permease
MNVLLPSLVKRRDPARAGLLIGIYLLSLSAGSILSSLIAIPSTASGGSARLTLGLWALPAIAAAVAWLPDPAAAASLSAFAQGARYLVTRPRARSPSGSCTPQPAVGHSRSWRCSRARVLACELVAGWQAARARTLPDASCQELRSVARGTEPSRIAGSEDWWNQGRGEQR